MTFGRMKVSPADIIFSKYIRMVNHWTCVRCGRIWPEGARYLTNSHYFGRGMHSVRFDPDNCDPLCWPGCHHYWEKEDREAYRAYMVRKLGQNGFDALNLRAHTPRKPDEKLTVIYYSGLVKQLQKEVKLHASSKK